jgi:hypothetical protein
MGGIVSIELLTICEWIGAGMHKTDVPNPTWEQIDSAIRALDGRRRNDLYLHPDADNPETYLAVGGGDERYIVSGSIDNERFRTVVMEPLEDAQHERLVVGGQAGDFPRNWILDVETALRAARSFFESGDFGGGELTWIEA